MPDGLDRRAFRDALGSFATGVTIVTTHDGRGNDIGLTANSFNSVSLDPPMVLWSLAKSSGSLDVFNSAPEFAVHILASDQEALSNRFASKGHEKFAGLEVLPPHGIDQAGCRQGQRGSDRNGPGQIVKRQTEARAAGGFHAALPLRRGAG
jgi:3-hydroxy-9,10-secoandrosta-1,3,5(10)-triene-9,17-dione monooxygenase reductase component